MTKRHRVFVSYHHANDQNYKNIFALRFGNAFGVIDRGDVELGDIKPDLATETIRQKIRDEYLRDCSVTVVLVGTETWQRKHVDWEIGATLRDTLHNPRGGLLGILLPTYQRAHGDTLRTDRAGRVTNYNPRSIPPRLHDNVGNGYASLHLWSEQPDDVAAWIHAAYNRKSQIVPDNSYPTFRNNRSGVGWS
ncbi:MAG: TIR domain-containing protein [Kofleriaceae bacterium]